MNRFVLCCAVVGVLSAVVPSQSAQAVVTSGEIYLGEFGGDPFDAALDLKIDRITFDVTAGTTVNFDALVGEVIGFDLNNDGEITNADFQMSLFNSANAVLVQHDDGPVGSDGSIFGSDGNFNYTFSAAGTYFLAVGNLYFEPSDGLAGVRADAGYIPPYHFDWQVTLTATDGTISNVVVDSVGVPEPASLSLLALSSLAIVRRRR